MDQLWIGRPRTRAAWLAPLLLVASISAAAAVQGPAAADLANPPNVVVVMTDDQTAASLRVMPKVRNQLADHGARFDNAHASYPLCCPSRATNLTGQYAHNHGVMSNRPPTGGYSKLEHSSTLATWLQDAGYRTGLIGKVMNNYPNDPDEIPPGWTEWYGLPGSSTYLMYGYKLNENGTLVKYGNDPDDYQTDVFARKAATFIFGAASRPAPFFLWVTPTAPHREHTDRDENPRPAPRHSDVFDREPLPDPPSFDERDVSDKPEFIREEPRLDAEMKDRLRREYRGGLGSLLAVDDAVGTIVSALRQTGELENTLIVFTSDNGRHYGEHRLIGKKILYEEATRVPLVIRGPGVPADVRREQPVANVDLAPTILDLTGASSDRVMDGRSLVPLAGDGDRGDGRDLLLENEVSRAIRTRRFVYTEHQTDERELYDLDRDPFQLRSRHQDPDYRDNRKRLAQQLDELKDCSGEACRR